MLFNLFNGCCMRSWNVDARYDETTYIPVTELSQSTFIKHELDEWIQEWAPSPGNVKNEISQRNSCATNSRILVAESSWDGSIRDQKV